MKLWTLITAMVLLGSIAAGCKLGGGLEVEAVSVSANKPSNVLLYVMVARDGKQVSGLTADNFRIAEDRVELDGRQVHLTMLPPDLQVVHQAVVLVDMSRTLGPIERASLVKNLRRFIAKLRQRQAVTVYAYDGAQGAHMITHYGRAPHAGSDEADPGLDRIMEFNRLDSSTSLYSAVVSGVRELEKALEGKPQPVRVGSVIVVAQSPDLAGRVPEQEVWELVHESHHRFYLVTVGDWAKDARIEWLGRDGIESAVSFGVLGTTLDRLAQSIEDAGSRHYLLGYCSPARGGPRMVTLTVETTGDQGKPVFGDTDFEIDSTGFAPGCSPAELGAAASPPPPPEPAEPEPSPAETQKKPRSAPRGRPSKPDPKDPKIVEPPPGLGYE